MPAKSNDWPEELKGPDRRHMYPPGSLPKNKRWLSKDYLKFVSELPCVACHLKNDTIVAHHLKGRGAPLSGGAGRKANDLFTMPLCYECHASMHNGDTDLLNNQFFFILLTVDKALKAGVISAEYVPYETYAL
jgi:hypothetical protein